MTQNYKKSGQTSEESCFVKAEVISIGDEMTNGQRLDTNSQWLSQQLAEIGVTTVRHTTAADDLDANIEVFASAAQRADVVISTGGLGPTLDDLTREALAAAFHAPLELDAASLKHIEGMFALRNRPMPERNRVQALLPQGSIVIPNPHGTAPGIDLTVATAHTASRKSRIFALPGVPAEMIEMWFGSVRERIVEHLGLQMRPLMFHTVKVFGLGESDIEAKLPDMMRRDREPRVGITVSRATISLRIAAQAETEEEFERAIAPTVEEIHRELGVLVFGTGEDELEDAVFRDLERRKQTLALLEIGPAALASQWLRSAAPKYSTAQVHTISCDSIAHASQLLAQLSIQGQGTQQATWNDLPSLAQAMKQIFKTDLALVFGTYASDAELAVRKPAADVDIAIAGDGLPSEVHTRRIIGHPDILNDRVAKSALDQLRLTLLRQS